MNVKQAVMRAGPMLMFAVGIACVCYGLLAGVGRAQAERPQDWFSANAPAMKTWHVGDIPYRMGRARVDVVEFEHVCLYVVATADGVATSTSPKTEAGCH